MPYPPCRGRHIRSGQRHSIERGSPGCSARHTSSLHRRPQGACLGDGRLPGERGVGTVQPALSLSSDHSLLVVRSHWFPLLRYPLISVVPCFLRLPQDSAMSGHFGLLRCVVWVKAVQLSITTFCRRYAFLFPGVIFWCCSLGSVLVCRLIMGYRGYSSGVLHCLG